MLNIIGQGFKIIVLSEGIRSASRAQDLSDVESLKEIKNLEGQ